MPVIACHFLPWVHRYHFSQFISSVTQLLIHVRLFVTPWTTARQASRSITNSWSPPKPMSIVLVMPSNHLILCLPFSSYPQSFPASGSFQMSQLFASGGQSIGVSASASVPPMKMSLKSQQTYTSIFTTTITIFSSNKTQVANVSTTLFICIPS